MKKDFDVIVIGELNVDIILNNIEGYPEVGKEKIAANMSVVLGSSSAIFASNLSSLGAKVAFIGKTGTDNFSDVIINSLNGKGVDTSHIIKSPTLNTGATIVLNYDEDRAMVTYPGAMNDFSLKDIDFDFVSRAKHVHFSSCFLQPGIKKDIVNIFRKAHEIGLTTSLDPQWDPEEKWDLNLSELLPVTDVFLPNIKEFEFLTRTSSLNEGLEKVKSDARNIAIKHGSDGAYLWNGKKVIHQNAFLNKQVVDCIGAGDSFNAGFIFKFVQQAPLEKCLEVGALTGAINTTGAGGTSAFVSQQAIKDLALKRFDYSF